MLTNESINRSVGY